MMYTLNACEDKQPELEIHVGMDLSCSVLDVMYILNAL